LGRGLKHSFLFPPSSPFHLGSLFWCIILMSFFLTLFFLFITSYLSPQASKKNCPYSDFISLPACSSIYYNLFLICPWNCLIRHLILRLINCIQPLCYLISM
jgi:hypothetical protein